MSYTVFPTVIYCVFTIYYVRFGRKRDDIGKHFPNHMTTTSLKTGSVEETEFWNIIILKTGLKICFANRSHLPYTDEVTAIDSVLASLSKFVNTCTQANSELPTRI